MADDKKKLRSQWWFDDPHDIGMTAMYVERYLNFGITREELRSGRPIIRARMSVPPLLSCQHINRFQKRMHPQLRRLRMLPV